jgi:hypothetical protein
MVACTDCGHRRRFLLRPAFALWTARTNPEESAPPPRPAKPPKETKRQRKEVAALAAADALAAEAGDESAADADGAAT